MQGPNSGKLVIHIEEADLKRDTEIFSKMDPFCKMFYNGKTFKTAVKDGAGKKPKWNQRFELDILDHNDEIKFEVHD
jgi:Ca2+-dependent lipid-binding protein